MKDEPEYFEYYMGKDFETPKFSGLHKLKDTTDPVVFWMRLMDLIEEFCE